MFDVPMFPGGRTGLYRKVYGDRKNQRMRGGLVFCISGELNIIRVVREEWIGSFAQPNVENLPPATTTCTVVSTDQIGQSCPPAHTDSGLRGLVKHLWPVVGIAVPFEQENTRN
jgi:hypothetical protein